MLDALTDTFFPVLGATSTTARAARRRDLRPAGSRASWRRSPHCAASWSACAGSSPRSATCWPAASTTSSKSPACEADSRNYFRDVYDHAIRISDQIDSYRDLLAGTRDAYLSVVSNRLNQITKQLTVVATIFLPLSFIVGFFGQNFKWMVDQHRHRGGLLVLGIGSLVLSVIGLLFWFRRGSYL